VQNAVLVKEQTMKLARVGVIAAAIVVAATVAWAQKPDFSGTWTLDPASAPAADGRGRGGGALGNGPATVKQTADALPIERTMGEAKVALTYKLDGTESRNLMMGRGVQPVDSVSTAKWDGPTLGDGRPRRQSSGGRVHPGLDRRGQHADGGNHQRGTQKRVYKKYVVNELPVTSFEQPTGNWELRTEPRSRRQGHRTGRW
jgi:hypothetical protein